MTLEAASNYDEATGAVLDLTGNGHGFTPSGNTIRTASGAGHTDKGLTQSSTSIDAGPSLFGQTASRTLMMWLKMPADFTGWVMEWHLTTGNTGVWGLLCLSGQIGYRGRNAGGTTAFASRARPTDGAWHHYAGTFDTADNKVRLYYDGVLATTTTALSGGIATNADLINMFDTTVGTPPIVDDARVYNEALSQATIASLMDTPVGADTVPEVTGAASLTLSATAASTKAAGSSGVARIDLSARAAASKLTGQTGALRVSLGSWAAATKVAVATGTMRLTVASSGQAVKVADSHPAATFNLRLSATAAKLATATGTAGLSLASAGVTAQPQIATGRTEFRLGASAAAAKIAVATGVAGLTLSAVGTRVTDYISGLHPVAATRRQDGTATTRRLDGTAVTREGT